MFETLVSKAVETIEGYADGTSDCTARILRSIDPKIDEEDLFFCHNKIEKEIKKRGKVTLDYSAHYGKEEGMPYNLDFVVKTKKH